MTPSSGKQRPDSPCGSHDPRADPNGEFVEDLLSHLGRLLSPMRIGVGTLHLRAELGRILLMDSARGGPAMEPGIGWIPPSLAERLNRASKHQPTHVTFTKIISTFGEDADYLAGLNDGEGNRLWDRPQKFVFYDFICRRTRTDAHGQAQAWHDVVVEVDGTRANDFSYKLRAYPERASPVWTHCLYRHWDLSFVLTLTPGAKLEALHGSFATSLLKSLVVRSVFSPLLSRECPKPWFVCLANLCHCRPDTKRHPVSGLRKTRGFMSKEESLTTR